MRIKAAEDVAASAARKAAEEAALAEARAAAFSTAAAAEKAAAEAAKLDQEAQVKVDTLINDFYTVFRPILG